MQLQVIKESVYEVQMRRLEDEGVPVAVDRLIKNARDDSLPGPVQNMASKTILDHAAKAREGRQTGKEAGEMTLAELENMRREAERETMFWRKLADAKAGRIEEAEIVPDEPETVLPIGAFG